MAPWMWYEHGAWVPSACLVHCAAGPAPPSRGQALIVGGQLVGVVLVLLVAVLMDDRWPALVLLTLTTAGIAKWFGFWPQT